VYGPLILRFSSCHNTWFPSTTCCVSFLQIRLPKAHAHSKFARDIIHASFAARARVACLAAAAAQSKRGVRFSRNASTASLWSGVL
jgi:hypothetical protein